MNKEQIFFKLSQEIIAFSVRLHQKDYLAGCDGNVSALFSKDTIIITPAGRPKWTLKPEEMALMDLNGEPLSQKRVSSEKFLHLEVYHQAKKAKFVAHAHPPTAVAWTIARPELKALPAECVSEIIPTCEEIPIVPFAIPGSPEMAEMIRPYLPHHRAMILARHGVLVWGESLEEVQNGVERIEHASKILKAAVELGGLTFLKPEEIIKLKEIRNKVGEKLL